MTRNNWLNIFLAMKEDEKEIKSKYEYYFSKMKCFSEGEYRAEFVIGLNWCIRKYWEEKGDEHSLPRLFNDLRQEADNYALDNLKGEELTKFLQLVD